MGQITIYALCDPFTKERRYIGKARDLNARIRSHRWEAQSGRLHTRKVNWLRSLGCDPFVEILEVCAEKDWQEIERRWIAEARTQGLDLTNYADGGQTSPVEGKGHTEATKQKCRESALRWGAKPPSRKGQTPWNKGVSPGRVVRDQISATLKGNIPWNKGVRSSYCPVGHLYSPENTRIRFRKSENRFYQSCRTCMRQRKLERRLRRAA